MTPRDPYVTFDPKLKRPLMKLRSMVLLTEFVRNRMKPLETEACPANSRLPLEEERKKKEEEHEDHNNQPSFAGWLRKKEELDRAVVKDHGP